MPFNFIEEICIGTPGESESIKVFPAYPLKQDSTNCMTVIAGRNRSGKSHILINTEKCLSSHNEAVSAGKQNLNPPGYTPSHSNVILKLTSANRPASALLITDLDFIMKKTARIPLQKDIRKSRGEISTHIENIVRNAFISFVGDQLKSRLEEFSVQLDLDKWNSDQSYRENCISYLDANYIYRCINRDDVVDIFENLSMSSLYLKYRENVLTLHMRCCKNHVLPITQWSHGQRALLIYLILIKYTKYDILMIDEIENHLHPEFITKLCSFIKEHAKQAIVVTHHPHLIFSKYVDSISYIEVLHSTEINPDSELHEDGVPKNALTSLQRRIVTLNNDVEKIVASFELFDKFDNQLLRLSQITVENVTQSVLETFNRVFDSEIVAATNRDNPDVQSDKLGEFLVEKIKAVKAGLRILDFGSGKGRTFVETNKRVIPVINGQHIWDLWEPNDEVRNELAQSLLCDERYASKINIVNDIKDIRQRYYDIIVLANVLHECNPDDIATILETSVSALKENSEIVIIEMFPLLSPEKYAVPYTSHELNRILRKSGFIAESSTINIRNSSISAYWIKAKYNPKCNSKMPIKDAVLYVWNDIADRCCGEYKGKCSVSSQEQLINVMNELTTIASIQSYKYNYWDQN